MTKQTFSQNNLDNLILGVGALLIVVAAVLQRIAAETVFSDLERWHISAITLDTESH